MGRRELEHFMIGDSYGGNQDWFKSFMMRIGGCGAETACDSSLYFALHKGLDRLYPFAPDELTQTDYVEFSCIMEKYLWPRMSGINKIETFAEGYSKYLDDIGESRLTMDTFDGTEPVQNAAKVLREQIDNGFPVPALTLNHRNKSFKDFNWHWYLINGYDDTDEVITDDEKSGGIERDIAKAGDEYSEEFGGLKVKAVTYSGWTWVDFRKLWETGHVRRGGLILFRLA